MKIAFLSPVSCQGLQHYFSRDILPKIDDFPGIIPIVDYVLREGHKVVFVTLSKKVYKPQKYYGDSIVLYIINLRQHSFFDALSGWNREKRIIHRVLDEEKCDIIHAQWPYEYSKAALSLDADRTLITMRDWPETIWNYRKQDTLNNIHDYIGRFYWYKKYRMGRCNIRNAKYISSVSPYMDKYISELNDIAEHRVIPNAIDGDDLTCDEKVMNKEAKVIVAINNAFDVRKNVQILFYAFRIIQKSIPHVVLRLYGSGFEKHGEAERWADRKELNSTNIDYRGKVDKATLVDQLKEADLLIHTSLEESFGMVLIEAMAQKVPVMGGISSGAVPWVLNGGKAGILVDVTNDRVIAESAVNILSNSEMWHGYSTRGFQRVKNNFIIDVTGKQYMQYYSDIVDVCSKRSKKNDS